MSKLVDLLKQADEIQWGAVADPAQKAAIRAVYTSCCRDLNKLVTDKPDLATTLVETQKPQINRLFCGYFVLLSDEPESAEPLMLHESLVQASAGEKCTELSRFFIRQRAIISPFTVSFMSPEVGQHAAVQALVERLQNTAIAMSKLFQQGIKLKSAKQADFHWLAALLNNIYDAYFKDKLSLSVEVQQVMRQVFLYHIRLWESLNQLEPPQVKIARRIAGLLSTVPLQSVIDLVEAAEPIGPLDLTAYSVNECLHLLLSRLLGKPFVEDKASQSQSFFDRCCKGDYQSLAPVEKVKNYLFYYFQSGSFLLSSDELVLDGVRMNMHQFTVSDDIKLVDIFNAAAVFGGTKPIEMTVATELAWLDAALDFAQFLRLLSQGLDGLQDDFWPVLGNLVSHLKPEPAPLLSMAFAVAHIAFNLVRSLQTKKTADLRNKKDKTRFKLAFQHVEKKVHELLRLLTDAILQAAADNPSDDFYRYFVQNAEFVYYFLGYLPKPETFVAAMPPLSKTVLVKTVVDERNSVLVTKLKSKPQVVDVLAHNPATRDALHAVGLTIQPLPSQSGQPWSRELARFKLYNPIQKNFANIKSSQWFYQLLLQWVKQWREQGGCLWIIGSSALKPKLPAGDLDWLLAPGDNQANTAEAVYQQVQAIVAKAGMVVELTQASSVGIGFALSFYSSKHLQRFKLDCQFGTAAELAKKSSFLSTNYTSNIAELNFSYQTNRLVATAPLGLVDCPYPTDDMIYIYPRFLDRLIVAKHFFRDFPYLLKTMVKFGVSIVGVQHVFHIGMRHLLEAAALQPLVARAALFLSRAVYRHAGMYALLKQQLTEWKSGPHAGFCLAMLHTLYFVRTSRQDALEQVGQLVGLLRQDYSHSWERQIAELPDEQAFAL